MRSPVVVLLALLLVCTAEDEEEKIPGEGSLFPRSYGLGNLVVGSSSKNEPVGLPVGTGIHHQEKSLYHQKELGCYQ
ncbi:hypothetical protein Tco_0142126 [Tanacetum coccineum]